MEGLAGGVKEFDEFTRLLSVLSLNQKTGSPLLGMVLNAVIVSPLQYTVVPETTN